MSNSACRGISPNRRSHQCHWPGCALYCEPRFWGCKPHWFALPRRIRDRIWSEYTNGQEIYATPTKEYLKAADEAHWWAVLRNAGLH